MFKTYLFSGVLFAAMITGLFVVSNNAREGATVLAHENSLTSDDSETLASYNPVPDEVPPSPPEDLEEQLEKEVETEDAKAKEEKAISTPPPTALPTPKPTPKPTTNNNRRLNLNRKIRRRFLWRSLPNKKILLPKHVICNKESKHIKSL